MLKIRQDTWQRLLVFLIIAYPLLWIWQGLDFTDTGFAITNANLALTAPNSIHYWGFNYWLTNIVGALWLRAFGWLGLFGFRLVSALLMLFTNGLVYLTCRRFVRPIPLLVSMLIGETLIERMYWLNYDNLSAFLFMLTGFLLIRGIVSSRNWIVFAAGLVFGVTLFARVTNLAGFIIVAAIVAAALSSRTSIVKPLLQIVTFAVGMVISAAAVVGIIARLGQLQEFMGNLSVLFSIAGGHANTHSSGRLIAEFSSDEKLALTGLLYAAVFVAFIVLGSAVLSRLRVGSLVPVFVVLSAVVAAGFAYSLTWDRYHFVAYLTGILYGLLITSVILGIWRKDVQWTATSAVAVIILFSLPLGSDLGIRLAVYGMYLALPVAAHLLTTELPKVRGIVRSPGVGVGLRTLAISTACALLVVGGVTGYLYTYRDTSHRLSMHASLASPKLRFTFTTPDRAKVVNQLFAELPHYVRPGDTLMAYEELSLVYYVTDTVPYLDTSWPMLYEPNAFANALQTAVEAHSSLPVVVRAKEATAKFDWPDVSGLRMDWRHKEDRILMNRFLQQHRYVVAWQNSFFQILVPPGFQSH